MVRLATHVPQELKFQISPVVGRIPLRMQVGKNLIKQRGIYNEVQHIERKN